MVICAYLLPDIYHKNILCELDDRVVEEYLKIVPTANEAARLDPDTPIRSTPMKAPRDFIHLNVRLADFGQAAYTSKDDDDDEDQPQLPGLRAPEVILGLPWDTKADIWNFACFVSFETRVHHSINSDLGIKGLGGLREPEAFRWTDFIPRGVFGSGSFEGNCASYWSGAKRTCI